MLTSCWQTLHIQVVGDWMADNSCRLVTLSHGVSTNAKRSWTLRFMPSIPTAAVYYQSCPNSQIHWGPRQGILTHPLFWMPIWQLVLAYSRLILVTRSVHVLISVPTLSFLRFDWDHYLCNRWMNQPLHQQECWEYAFERLASTDFVKSTAAARTRSPPT